MEGLPPPDCVRHKAECAFRAGRFADAVAAVEGRRDAESLYWRARAHNELAVEAFSKLELLPPSPESHAFRAELYRNQGRHVESVAELREAAKLAPGDPRIQRELATSLYLSRDYDAAAPLLQGLLKQAPRSAELSFMYGDTLLQAQKVESAIPPLEAAVRLDASLISARASLGRAYLLQGRHADAIPHLKAALGSDEDGSLHYQLARAYQATGQPELAKQMLAKYEAMQKENEIVVGRESVVGQSTTGASRLLLIAIVWFVATSSTTCLVPSGHTISIRSIRARVPRPKWTGAWTDDA